jgi:hypothetical protein
LAADFLAADFLPPPFFAPPFLPPPFFADFFAPPDLFADFFEDLLEAISSSPYRFDVNCVNCCHNVANNRAAVTNFLTAD